MHFCQPFAFFFCLCPHFLNLFCHGTIVASTKRRFRKCCEGTVMTTIHPPTIYFPLNCQKKGRGRKIPSNMGGKVFFFLNQENSRAFNHRQSLSTVLSKFKKKKKLTSPSPRALRARRCSKSQGEALRGLYRFWSFLKTRSAKKLRLSHTRVFQHKQHW